MTSAVDHPGGLPQLAADGFLADGGLETSLLFHHGVDLPLFAAFPLLGDEVGRAELRAYYLPYLEVAATRGLGIVLDTPTWRASLDWAAQLGVSPEALVEVNAVAVDFVRAVVDEHRHRSGHQSPVVVNGTVGPRGDGYVVGDAMGADEAADYHALQVRAMASRRVDLVTATTMTYVEEAIGVTRAAIEAGVPVAIGVTVETDGRLPSGAVLGEAIEEIDAATDGSVAYFMVNCAHPTHFVDQLATGEPWLERVKAVRANASRRSHAELDEADELDRGDVAELADDYRRLRSTLPDLRIVGGCCGTDHEHIAAIADVLVDELR